MVIYTIEFSSTLYGTPRQLRDVTASLDEAKQIATALVTHSVCKEVEERTALKVVREGSIAIVNVATQNTALIQKWDV